MMLLVLTPAMAQRKQIGEAKTILLRGKDFAKAEKLMTDLLKDSANQENTRIYDIWLQAVEKQYSQLVFPFQSIFKHETHEIHEKKF